MQRLMLSFLLSRDKCSGNSKGDGEAAPSVEPFIGKEYKEGEKFCYILAPWGEFVEIPAALGGKLVEIKCKTRL